MTKSATGLYAFDQSAPLADTGALGGDLMVGDTVAYTGVRIKDLPAVLNAMLNAGTKYLKASQGGLAFSPGVAP